MSVDLSLKQETTNYDPPAGSRQIDVLLVEDSHSLAKVYCEYMRREPILVKHVTTGADALAILQSRPPKVMILDIRLPDMDGLHILDQVKAKSIPTNIIVITAHGSVDMALSAVNKGARDFLEKPFNADRLLMTLRNEFENWRLNELVDAIDTTRRGRYCGFIGSSLQMQAIYRIIDSASVSDAPIFITGESGSGKEICANAIHEKSNRSEQSLVIVNCATLSDEQLAMELYGRVASDAGSGETIEPGAIAKADGGTLFLDEITEVSPKQQSELLRFVESGVYRPLYSSQSYQSNVRLVCSSTSKPGSVIQEKQLREDLYYRINVIPVSMVPLRHREADVLEIASYFLEQYSVTEGKNFESIDPDAEQALLSYPWPGNVRELRNVIRNIVVLHNQVVVKRAHLPELLLAEPLQDGRDFTGGETLRGSSSVGDPRGSGLGDESAVRPLWIAERETIEAAIDHFGGNIPKAAAALEVSPSTIYRKRHGWRDLDAEA